MNTTTEKVDQPVHRSIDNSSQEKDNLFNEGSHEKLPSVDFEKIFDDIADF